MFDGNGVPIYAGDKVTAFFSLRDQWLNGYILRLKDGEALVSDHRTFDRCGWAMWAKPDLIRKGWPEVSPKGDRA